MNRRRFITRSLSAATATAFAPNSFGAESSGYRFDPSSDIIAAPGDPSLWPQFRAQLKAWREQRRGELNYSDSLYQRPDFDWVPGNYTCYFLMLNDERFYDAAAGRYHVAEWLAMTEREFGGCDSVVLWHAYPRIGLDDRNQYDFYRNQPGGLAGLRKVVDGLHAAGVRSYINYNPWDVDTRREGKPDLDMLCEIVAALDVDGIFLDTMKEGAAGFRDKLDAIRPGIALEGEIALPMERIADHHMAWAQGFKDSTAPGVVRNKWFERHHQLHHVHRWGHDRTALFQTAFMNGTGTMLWDNVFGSWVGYSQREKSILRAMLPIQRRFTSLFSGERWTPLVPTDSKDIYASLWEGQGIRLWTLVNRSEQEHEVALTGIQPKSGEILWDLVAGAVVKSAGTTIRPRGIGCIIAAEPSAHGKDFTEFIARQKLTDQSANWDSSFPNDIRTKLKPAASTLARPRTEVPADMAVIPGGPYPYDVRFRIRECGWYESDPNTIERFGYNLHQFRNLKSDEVVAPFALDLTPVTNAAFAAFIKESGYKPQEPANFLKHWNHDSPPPGSEDHPVVFVDLDDARAYAKWANKRLPTEMEWQFAAQGTDGRKFPWGNEAPDANGERCNGSGPATTPVKQFPAGRSPFGLYDMCGNTWEWTESERSDGVNRFAILRGGSHYKTQHSHWYMDGGAQEVSFACKYLLQWPGLDRCGTIGFRCVADIKS